MRDPERRKRMMKLFLEIWHNHPDMRLGQLYENLLAFYAKERGILFNPERMMWLMEDADFEAFLKNFKGFE